MIEMLAATLAQEVTRQAITTAERWPLSRGTGRAERLETYFALQRSVMRARLRIDTLLTVHSAQYNVAHIAAWVTGYPLIVRSINQLSDDLTEVTSDWQRVQLAATPDAAAAADALVLAVCSLMKCVDPGWIHPKARATHRVDLQNAKALWEAAAQQFILAARADAAPRREDRRSARNTYRNNRPTKAQYNA